MLEFIDFNVKLEALKCPLRAIKIAISVNRALFISQGLKKIPRKSFELIKDFYSFSFGAVGLHGEKDEKDFRALHVHHSCCD